MFSKLLVPDTVNYMIAGYVVVTGAVGIYIASLVIRWNRALKAYRGYDQTHDQQ